MSGWRILNHSGSGAIVSADLKESLRSHHDIQNKQNLMARRKVEAHYNGLAERAASHGYAIDLVCASLEQTGLWEMQMCVQRSGGQVLSAETFSAPHLRRSLERMVERHEGHLQMGYSTTFEMRTSRECKSIQVLGINAGEGSQVSVDKVEAAEANCFVWNSGAISSHSCCALVMERGAHSTPAMGDSHLMQLSALYTHSSGRRRQRITTLRMPRLTRSVPVQQLLPALDQQAAAALIIRHAIATSDAGVTPQEVRQPFALTLTALAVLRPL